MLADKRYCYPLTIADFASRYLLSCEALSTTKEIYAFSVFDRVFKEFGLPKAIRTDNGVPFASPHALFGLSKLSVWWLRLGIGIERIKPGHPEQNGRHERMHLTLKKEATKPAANNFLQQQAKFDDFIECFNHERPHQALNMKYPVELYRRSPRPYRGLSELRYPFHDRTITVTQCGRSLHRPAQDQPQHRLRRSERGRPRR
jgi:putative transposase